MGKYSLGSRSKMETNGCLSTSGRLVVLLNITYTIMYILRVSGRWRYNLWHLCVDLGTGLRRFTWWSWASLQKTRQLFSLLKHYRMTPSKAICGRRLFSLRCEIHWCKNTTTKQSKLKKWNKVSPWINGFEYLIHLTNQNSAKPVLSQCSGLSIENIEEDS